MSPSDWTFPPSLSNAPPVQKFKWMQRILNEYIFFPPSNLDCNLFGPIDHVNIELAE